MLCKLAISNIAVIDKAEITLSDGFTVLTGETGAGKSLIIDAITMVLGQRTGRDIIRAGEKCATCEAAFFTSHPLADETGMLILRRELFADGRNLCSINGNMVTVAGLREVGESLLAIHGQHDTEALMHRKNHLAFVDAYAKTEEEIASYKALYTERKTLLSDIAALSEADSEKEKRLDMLSFWIREIEEAAPEIGEDEALEERREYLRHSEKIRTAASRAYGALMGEDGGARDLLSEAARALSGVSDFDARLEKALESVQNALYEAEETGDVLRDIFEEETDGGALDEVEARLDVLQKLKGKYGGTIERVIEEKEKMEKERDDIETADEKLAEKRAALSKIEKEIEEAASALSKKREEGAAEFSARVVEELSALDMEKVRFLVQIEKKDYGEDGADAVEFFISTNPAEDPKAMAKIASGGELSRICLALRTVLANTGDAMGQTLIFDEIDTGISGRAAARVGEKLSNLAAARQILCVTHLPQIAARAASQFKIDKRETAQGFSTVVEALSKEGRILEIARMINGDAITEKTMQTAEEMLA